MFVLVVVFPYEKVKKEQGECVSILSLLTGVALVTASKLEYDG